MERHEYERLPEEVKLDIKRVRSVDDIVTVLWLLEEARHSPKVKGKKQ